MIRKRYERVKPGEGAYFFARKGLHELRLPAELEPGNLQDLLDMVMTESASRDYRNAQMIPEVVSALVEHLYSGYHPYWKRW